MEKRRYLQEFTAVCRNCQGDGVKKTWRADDTLKQKPAVRSVCPVCEGSGIVKISGVRILTILPAKPQTVPDSKEESEIAGQARNDGDGCYDRNDVGDCRRGAWSAPAKLLEPIEGDISFTHLLSTKEHISESDRAKLWGKGIPKSGRFKR